MEKEIKCPYCGKEVELEVDVNLKVKDDVQPAPEPDDEQEVRKLGFDELAGMFNKVLMSRGYNMVLTTMNVYEGLKWQYNYADSLYNENHWAFLPSTYPLLYDYRGTDTSDSNNTYNAMQAWMMAMSLAELVPDSGDETNTQTELFKLAYEIGGGRHFALYNQKALKADPYAMREAASIIQSICRGDKNISAQIDIYRNELGGKPIPASCWEELGYKDEKITDASGWRRGYRMKKLGYCVNTELFLPDSPAPRVPGTTVCDLQWPWQQGQPEYQFNTDGNYKVDKDANDFFVKNYDMMSQTPLDKWNSYPIEKQNRLVNASAVPPCTFRYMFGAPIKVRFDGIIRKSYDGKITADYFCFSPTSENTGLALDGPFSDLEGMYRYNANPRNQRESFVSVSTGIFDNFRFPTQDPNYGRCRPGCACTHDGGELNPIHGSDENELYNVDLTTMVADTDADKEKYAKEDGFAQDSPRSYVSGHSAQVWGLALLLTQFDNDNTTRPRTWIRKAYEYSINRSLGRFHWNSDCVYGRLFGSLAVPIVRAMSGLQDSMKAFADFVVNPEPAPAPTPQGDWAANIIIKNETDAPIQSTGEVRIYVTGHEGVNVYTPNAVQVGAAITIPNGGEYAYDTHCEGNGFTLDDSYNGKALEDGRIYDERHWKNADWTPAAKVLIDTADSRCSSVLRKSGATYVLKIVNA